MNESIRNKVNCDSRLLDFINTRHLAFIGHTLTHDRLEKSLLMGMVPGSRGRGRRKTRLSDHLKDICGLTMVEMFRAAQDRDNWRRLVGMGATAARNRDNWRKLVVMGATAARNRDNWRRLVVMGATAARNPDNGC